jgi:hypothetical protein
MYCYLRNTETYRYFINVPYDSSPKSLKLPVPGGSSIDTGTGTDQKTTTYKACRESYEEPGPEVR